jgi:AraC-like DNA-binding protein
VLATETKPIRSSVEIVNVETGARSDGDAVVAVPQVAVSRCLGQRVSRHGSRANDEIVRRERRFIAHSQRLNHLDIVDCCGGAPFVRHMPACTKPGMTDKHLTTRRSGRADAAGRAMRAWSARVAGHTWSEAAELSGFSDASNCLRAVRAYFGTLPAIEREDVRALWRQRHEALWAIALRDAKARRPGALRAGVAVARSAAQLDALDVPAVSVVVSPTAAEFEDTVRRLVEARGGRSSIEADIFADDPDD